MEIKGKMIARMLIPVILLGMLVVPLAAASTTVSIEDASAPQGETVTVRINITDVSGMCGANIWLSYDKNVVTVEIVDDGDIGTVTYSTDNDVGITKMNWDTTEEETGSFVFAYITLKVVGNPGDTCLLDLDVKELYDCELTDITHSADDGTFTIPLTSTPTATPPSGGGGGGGILFTPTPTLTPTLSPTPTPSLSPTTTPTPSPTPSLTPTTTPSATPEPVPGFEAFFAMLGLLAVAYLLKRRK
jgi:hypothetical protein